MSGPLDNYRPILVSPRLSSFSNPIGGNRNRGQMTEYQQAQLDLQKKKIEDAKNLKAKAEQDALEGLVAGVEIGNNFDVDMTEDHVENVKEIEQHIDVVGANAMQKEIDANPDKYITKPISERDIEFEKKLNDLALIKDKTLKRKEKLALIKEYGYDESEEDMAITKGAKMLGSIGNNLFMAASQAGDYLSPWRLFQTDSYKKEVDDARFNDYKKAQKFYEEDSPEKFIKNFRTRIRKIRKDNDNRELAQIRLAKKFSKDVEVTKQNITKDILLSPEKFNKKYQNQLNRLVTRIKNDTSLNTAQKLKALSYTIKSAQAKKASYERLRATIISEKQRQKKRQEKIMDAGLTELAKRIAKTKAERKTSRNGKTLNDLKREKLEYQNRVYKRENKI